MCGPVWFRFGYRSLHWHDPAQAAAAGQCRLKILLGAGHGAGARSLLSLPVPVGSAGGRGEPEPRRLTGTAKFRVKCPAVNGPGRAGEA
jgi:hypothetical protein